MVAWLSSVRTVKFIVKFIKRMKPFLLIYLLLTNYINKNFYEKTVMVFYKLYLKRGLRQVIMAFMDWAPHVLQTLYQNKIIKQ
jgi:hypothetical protein